MPNIIVHIKDEGEGNAIEFEVNTLFYELNSLIPILEAGHIIELWKEEI